MMPKRTFEEEITVFDMVSGKYWITLLTTSEMNYGEEAVVILIDKDHQLENDAVDQV